MYLMLKVAFKSTYYGQESVARQAAARQKTWPPPQKAPAARRAARGELACSLQMGRHDFSHESWKEKAWAPTAFMRDTITCTKKVAATRSSITMVTATTYTMATFITVRVTISKNTSSP